MVHADGKAMNGQSNAADTWFVFFAALCLISMLFTTTQYSVLPLFGILFLVYGLVGIWPDLTHAPVEPRVAPTMHFAPPVVAGGSRRLWRLTAMGIGFLLLAWSAAAKAGSLDRSASSAIPSIAACKALNELGPRSGPLSAQTANPPAGALPQSQQ
jgi:hypothetical protein